MQMSVPKIKMGFAEVGWFTITETEGADTYGSVTKFYGTREYSSEPQGEPFEVYSNCELAYSKEINDGYLINLTMLKFIDSVAAAWLGNTVDYVNKTNAEYKDQQKPRIGIVLRDITTDGEGEIQWYFNCRANARPTLGSKTQEKNLEAQYESMTIKALPRADGLVRYKTIGNSIPTTVPTVPAPAE
jgi:phi13 family phage major tail protein